MKPIDLTSNNKVITPEQIRQPVGCGGTCGGKCGNKSHIIPQTGFNLNNFIAKLLGRRN